MITLIITIQYSCGSFTRAIWHEKETKPTQVGKDKVRLHDPIHGRTNKLPRDNSNSKTSLVKFTRYKSTHKY